MRRPACLTHCLLWSALSTAALGQSIEGTVTDALTHSGLSGVSVTAESSGRKRLSAATDDKGHYSLNTAPPGVYNLDFQRAGYVPLRRSDPARQPLTLSTTNSVVSRNAELLPMARVSGRVVDKEKQPVAGAQVYLSLVGGGRGESAPANQEGNFTFNRVLPGEYNLGATAPATLTAPQGDAEAELDWVFTFYPGVTDRTAAATLAIGPGVLLVGQDIQLKALPVHHLRGVVEVNGQPAPVGTQVTVTEDTPATLMNIRRWTVPSGEGGQFDVAKLPDGHYQVSAEAKAQEGVIWRGFTGEQLLGRDLDRVKVILRPPFSWSGTAVLEGPSPSNSGTVSSAPLRSSVGLMLFPEVGGGDALRSAVSDSEGRFFVPLIYAGSYRLSTVPARSSASASPVPPSLYLDAIRLGGNDMTGQAIPVQPGTTPFELVFRSDGGSVRGVTDANVNVVLVPIEDARRSLYSLQWATAAADGGFSFLGVRPGDYWVVAIDPDLSGWTLLHDFTQKYEPGAVRVHVKASEMTMATGVKLAHQP